MRQELAPVNVLVVVLLVAHVETAGPTHTSDSAMRSRRTHDRQVPASRRATPSLVPLLSPASYTSCISAGWESRACLCLYPRPLVSSCQLFQSSVRVAHVLMSLLISQAEKHQAGQQPLKFTQAIGIGLALTISRFLRRLRSTTETKQKCGSIAAPYISPSLLRF